MKTCTKCGKEKSLDGFSKKSDGKHGRDSHCKTCKAAYKAERYAKNKDEILAKDREYRARNAEKVKARKARYYERRKDEINAKNAEYRADPENKKRIAACKAANYRENKEYILARDAQYRKRQDVRERNMERYQSKKGEFAEQARVYYAKNKHKRWEMNYRSRIRKFGFTPVVISFTESDLIGTYGDACFDCGGEWTDVDHVVPLRFGGEHSLGNCQPVCQPCNLARWHQYQREAYTLMANFYLGEAA